MLVIRRATTAQLSLLGLRQWCTAQDGITHRISVSTGTARRIRTEWEWLPLGTQVLDGASRSESGTRTDIPTTIRGGVLGDITERAAGGQHGDTATAVMRLLMFMDAGGILRMRGRAQHGRIPTREITVLQAERRSRTRSEAPTV